jgi:hypothetical protein
MTERDRTDELSQEELEASGGEQLPDRQVMTVIATDPTGWMPDGGEMASDTAADDSTTSTTASTSTPPEDHGTWGESPSS